MSRTTGGIPTQAGNLADQILNVRSRLAEGKLERREKEDFELLESSLRITYSCVSCGFDPAVAGMKCRFTCGREPAGVLQLRLSGKAIPIDPEVLEEQFRAADVRLRPGQTILIETGLAGRWIKRALILLKSKVARLRRNRVTGSGEEIAALLSRKPVLLTALRSARRLLRKVDRDNGASSCGAA